MNWSATFILFACILRSSVQKSTPEDTSYVAAVLEFEVSSNSTANLENYIAYIEEAAAKDADIVVFPEMTLTRGHALEIPINGLLREYPVPAAEPSLYDPVLVSLSEAAAANQVYVVVNIEEYMNCTANNQQDYCPEAIVYYFNTNIVFDRTGAIIDRYRKINLFGEFSRYPALNPELGVFTTDFGVTFGHFICFDLMFQVPAVQVVEKLNITNVIFTTMWFSEMPFLTAVQIQEAYAYALNVNLLASGANNVRVGSAGSGIYSGKTGALISTMPGLPTTRLLVSRVPKVPGQVEGTYPGPIYDPPGDADSLRLKQDPSLTAQVSKLLVPGFQEFELTQNEVTCKFTVRLNRKNTDVTQTFRAFVHDGTNTYAKRQIGVSSCAVVSCANTDIKSCPFRYNSSDTSVVIKELNIEMNTYAEQYNGSLQCDNIVYFPNSLQINKQPLNPKNFTLTSGQRKPDGGRETVALSLDKAQDSLVTFGIWGRIYTKDVQSTTPPTKEEIEYDMEFDDMLYALEERRLANATSLT